MALVQRSSTASTQPRKGQTPSAGTISKLSTATYTSGTLRQGGDGRAPDGGAIVDYPKGWRFLPVPHNSQAGEILKNHPKVIYHMDRLHNLGGVRTDASGSASYHKQQIANYHHELNIAPILKAEKEQKEREEEEQRQTIATLKMRVLELEKPIYEPITKITTDRSWSKYAILGIGVVIFLIILRRRA